ncbi:MAG: OsmC family protein [Candidatus Dadabacteria bacterium]|nr:OsmC family protein [Candidatus Dadabacteria bacterium]
METLNLTFKNRNNMELSARLDLPTGKPKTYALFAHCFSCSKNIKAAYHISHSLAHKGIAVLRFDFTGIGDSEGQFEDTNFSSNVDDIVDASNYLVDHYESPKILIGHSLGGTAVIKAAKSLKDLKAIVTIGSPFKPSHVEKIITNSGETDKQMDYSIKLGNKTFKIKKQFLDDLKDSDINDDLSSLNKALLVMHSPFDNVVSIDSASDIFLKAKHPKSFISLDNADHLLSEQSDSIYVGKLISEWASKYIDINNEKEEILSKDKKVVVQTANNNLKTNIFVGRHHIVADEPKSVGGTDLGPNPYDYLLASLGSCTTMTLKMYANRKGWNLDSAKVILNHQKIYAKDCEECETEIGKIDYIEREIELLGDLDKDQRNRLLEIADRCPVHRTLHSEIVVKTKLLE